MPEDKPVPGDADRDGDVDLTDLGKLSSNYGKKTGASWEQGDFDGDGDVDLADLSILASNYNKPQPNIPKETVRQNTTNIIDKLIVGKNASHKLIYEVQDHAKKIYKRNKSCWAASLNKTCISPYNSKYGFGGGGVLISPRHILYTEHYAIWPPCDIRFITENDEVIDATQINSWRVGFSDFRIGYFANDVPTSIKHAKILPADCEKYIDKLASGFPVLVTDQEEKALISNIRALRGPYDKSTTMIQPFGPRMPFYEDVVNLDSGNPVLSYIDYDPVVVTLLRSANGGPGKGLAVHLHVDEINAVMAASGSPYRCEIINLSKFIAVA